MRKLLITLCCCFLVPCIFAQEDLPGNHLAVLISDTWGARFRGEPPDEVLWGINQGYDFGISMDELFIYNPKLRLMGRVTLDRRDTGISMLRQSCLIYLTDNSPVTFNVTYFVDETSSPSGTPPRGYFAVRLEVRSSNAAYIERKFRLLVDEINREFTAPILPTSGRIGMYYQWGSAPSIWRRWPLELYYHETFQQESQITYYHFSQLGQNHGERNQQYSVQNLYNWIINTR
ncbi:MAG: hypothetical protein LBQ35_02690 [Spirochaetaceae bacterium]|jgi:hypothetical protein|nr:hypothetical protein [Spirochaetaceae bacterium]